MSGPGATTELLGWIAYQFSLIQPILPVFFGLLVAALFPIFTGSHASLSCPSSATKTKAKAKAGSPADDDEEEDEIAAKEDSAHAKMTGLSPVDALWFPVLGGLLLGGLYLLIKWMDDLSFLNKILNWWFSVLGLGTVGTLFADSLSVISSITFPQRWSDGSRLWLVRRGDVKYVSQAGGAPMTDGSLTANSSPFPGWISKIYLPSSIRSGLWSLRKALAGRYMLRMSMGNSTIVHATFSLNDLLGYTAGLLCSIVYAFVGQPWWLLNLFAFGSSYTVLQMMSPKTFWTGTMVLSALFFYDIYMVFFTPMMATVAMSLEIPVKLVIPRAEQIGDTTTRGHAMLGLGDVVLPGMLISMALRFDLYMFYLRKQTRRRSLRATVSEDENDHVPERPFVTVKALYRSATGRWGERFWTRPGYVGGDSSQAEPASFPKPYFYASLMGYIVGMIVTFGVLTFTHHAQPALLYLVPGVLLSVWAVAFLRGEVTEMWEYSEDMEDDKDTASNPGTSTRAKLTKPKHGSDNAPDGKTKQDKPNAIFADTSASSSAWEQRDLFAINFKVRFPSPPADPRSVSPTISPLIVQEIRKALDDDLDLRSSGGVSSNTFHSNATLHRAHPPNASGDGAHAEKRPRLG